MTPYFVNGPCFFENELCFSISCQKMNLSRCQVINLALFSPSMAFFVNILFLENEHCYWTCWRKCTCAPKYNFAPTPLPSYKFRGLSCVFPQLLHFYNVKTGLWRSTYCFNSHLPENVLKRQILPFINAITKLKIWRSVPYWPYIFWKMNITQHFAHAMKL